MFQIKVVEKIKTYIFNKLFLKIVPFIRECGKYSRIRQATDDNMALCFASYITKTTSTGSEYVIPIAF